MSSQPTSRKRAARPRRQASETLHLDDKDRVRAIAGPGDRFLILIEEELDVRLSAPGADQIVISGDTEASKAECAIYICESFE